MKYAIIGLTVLLLAVSVNGYAEIVNSDDIPVCGIDWNTFANNFPDESTINITLEIVKYPGDALALRNQLLAQGWQVHYGGTWTGVNTTQWTIYYPPLYKSEGQNPQTLINENSFYYIAHCNVSTYSCDTVDADEDGIPDISDGCPNDPGKSEPGTCGCGIPDTDSDTDGDVDCIDSDPYTWNPNQEEVAQKDTV